MTAALIVVACWLTPFVLIAAWILADRYLDSRGDTDERPEADAEWLAVLAATDTPIFAGLAAERTRAELDSWGREES